MDLVLVLATLALFAALAALSVIDRRTQRLPDYLTLPLMSAGCLLQWLYFNDWPAGLIGAAAGYGSFVLIELAYRYGRGRDGLGRGDAKLLAAGGAWCGWMLLPMIVLVASASALAVQWPRARKSGATQAPFAFGPYLSAAIALVWLYQIAAIA